MREEATSLTASTRIAHRVVVSSARTPARATATGCTTRLVTDQAVEVRAMRWSGTWAIRCATNIGLKAPAHTSSRVSEAMMTIIPATPVGARATLEPGRQRGTEDSTQAGQAQGQTELPRSQTELAQHEDLDQGAAGDDHRTEEHRVEEQRAHRGMAEQVAPPGEQLAPPLVVGRSCRRIGLGSCDGAQAQ